ncbi:MAG: TVP38/TMEM64 family protein, partial [Alphaproteobacteria bacterium]|nr:TVP38/TMEM64 family protein [Alphaproteobacteria bacterium]
MLQTLHDNRMDLMAFVHDYGVLAVVVFLGVYTASTALAIPGALVLTIAGGFLFGTLWGTVWVVIGATAGASLLFLVARTALGEALRARAGPMLKKIEAGFGANAFSYLLSLRLLPIFPFFIVNVVPAFVGVPLRTFVLATVLGIIPGSFVFASVGAGLGSAFEMVMEPTLASAITPEIIIALVSLAILALLPIVWKKLKAGRGL